MSGTPVGWCFSRSVGLRFLGFSVFYLAQGVPIGLLSIALPAWLAAQGAEAAEIASLVAITGLPWGFKLVAGPFMDRFSFPAMGRRRPWVIAAQTGLTLAMLLLVLVDDPLGDLWLLIVIGFVINAFAAVQDVAVDGMAIDVLPDNERGRANAFMAFGQVLGFSGFGALNGYLLNRFGLPLTALVSTFAVAAVLLFATFVREREGERLLPWTQGAAATPTPASAPSFSGIFRELLRGLLLPMSLLLIVVEFAARGAAGIALSIQPVLAVQGLGYGADQYAYWIGIMGAGSAFVGIFFGPFIDRFGARNLLVLGLTGSALATLTFALATALWGETLFVLAMLALREVFGQAFFIAMIALFMGVCWRRVAATQFAIYMSLANLSRSAGAGAYALAADSVGLVEGLYVATALLLLAALLTLFFDAHRHRERLQSLDTATAAPGERVAAGMP